MQKELEKIELELSSRLYKLFMEKFDGNKSAFARAAQCKETTIRRIFRNEQGITINLLLRLAHALDTTVIALLEGFVIQEDK
jgi:plasmid maintenance system antidote protein VapI